MQASERRRRPLTTGRPSCSASGRPRLFEHGTVDDGDGWCNGAQRGQGVELAIKRSLVRFPARARLPDYSGQVVHTHGPRRTESSLLHGVVHRMPLHLGRVGGQVPQIPSKVQRRSPCPDGDRGKPPENGAFAAQPQKLKNGCIYSLSIFMAYFFKNVVLSTIERLPSFTALTRRKIKLQQVYDSMSTKMSSGI